MWHEGVASIRLFVESFASAGKLLGDTRGLVAANTLFAGFEALAVWRRST